MIASLFLLLVQWNGINDYNVEKKARGLGMMYPEEIRATMQDDVKDDEQTQGGD